LRLNGVNVSGVKLVVFVDDVVHEVGITLIVKERHHIRHCFMNALQSLGVFDFSHLVLLLLYHIQYTMVDYVK